MRHLLVFNLKMDVDDPVLGFATGWVAELARHAERVTVLTMEARRVELPANVRVLSVGKEKGLSEPRRVVAFYRHVRRLLAEDPPEVCFAHMIPVFAVLFAPFARRHRIPVVLWYAHGSVPLMLRLAHLAVDRCVTPTPKGFKIPSRKLAVVGQGIDTQQFRPVEGVSPRPGSIVAVGRIAPVKRLLEAVEALALVRAEGLDATLTFVGAPAVAADWEYLARLRARIAALRLDEAVKLPGPLPFASMPDVYRRAEVTLNLSRFGPLDKALLEGIAAGCIPVSANESFRALADRHGVSPLAAGEEPADVARALLWALRLSDDQRAGMHERLREAVEHEDSLHRLARLLAGQLEDLAAGSARAANSQAQTLGPVKRFATLISARGAGLRKPPS